MELIQWRSEFSVGNEKIDYQHQKLVAMINDLILAREDGKGADHMHNVVLGLFSYVNIHFSFEESVMREINYPHLDEHKLLHQDLAEKVVNLKKAHDSGDNKELLSQETLEFLKSWLTDHILNEDTKLRDYLE